jgi:hypothetical protein
MELTLLPLIDDQKCFEWVRKRRCPEEITCPHCDSPQLNPVEHLWHDPRSHE